MAGKQPRGPRPWLDDFHLGGNGDYIYHGSHKKYSGANYSRFRRASGLCAAAVVAAVIGSGCLSVGELDNTPFVLIPYLLEVVLTVAYAWSAVRMLYGGELLRSYVHKQTVHRLPKLGVALAIAAFATLACAIVFSALHWPIVPGIWVYLALQIITVVSSICSVKALRATTWVDA